MKTMFKIFGFLFICILLYACGFSPNTPEEYFGRTTLNTNVFGDFGKRELTELSQRKISDLSVYEDGKTIPAKSYQDYILKNKVSYIDQYIQDVKNLKVTDETKPMIDASLEVFNFGKTIYETDYVKIAKMLDEKQPEQSIQKAIEDFENTKGKEFSEKYKKLMDVALPYAKENGITGKRIQYLEMDI